MENMERVDSTQAEGDANINVNAGVDAIASIRGRWPTATALDWDGAYREWLSEHLCKDPHCGIDALDIHHAFDLRFGSRDKESARALRNVEPQQMTEFIIVLVTDIFPETTLRNSADLGHQEWFSYIMGIRWSKLENCQFSVAIPLKVPSRIKDEAHPLLHLPQPTRSVAWLEIYFKSDSKVSLSMQSIGNLYECAFSRGADTHPYLSREDLRELVFKTFNGTGEVSVTGEYCVIRGISTNAILLRDCAVAEQVLKKKRWADYRRLVHAGLIHDAPTKPLNAFTAKLLDDPLVCLPLTKDRSIPGPFTERIRRRHKDPAGLFGDEEPGFPGVSLKKLQGRERRKQEEERNKNANADAKVPSPSAPLTVAQRNAVVRDVLAATPSS